MSRKTPRERLAERLEALGFILMGNIMGVLGGVRRMQFWDDQIVTWEVVARRPGDPEVLQQRLVSYDTMTACARRGIELGEEEFPIIFINAKKSTEKQFVSRGGMSRREQRRPW
jgi:hypothetical protein